MNESYVPQPGEAVLVTLRMTAFEQCGLGFECDSTAGPVIMYANEPAVVSVERMPVPLVPEPTRRGAVIVATVDGERVVGTLADAASKYPWWITPEGEWRAYGELADVSVVFGGVEF